MKWPYWGTPRSSSWFLGADHLGDYMHRWLLQTPWFTLRIHHILRSDEDRALHDHPWNFVSFILKGGYMEITTWDQQWYGAGSVIRRRAEDLHRLVLPPGEDAWTFVVTGPRVRGWGFQVPDQGWIPWRKAQELWAAYQHPPGRSA